MASAGQRDPLLLAAGELMRVTPAEPAQPDRLEQGVDLAAAALAGGQPEADVARHRQVREQAAFLRDVADPAPLRWEVDAGVVRIGDQLGLNRWNRPTRTWQWRDV
jgi:hypothetical protein